MTTTKRRALRVRRTRRKGERKVCRKYSCKTKMRERSGGDRFARAYMKYDECKRRNMPVVHGLVTNIGNTPLPISMYFYAKMDGYRIVYNRHRRKSGWGWLKNSTKFDMSQDNISNINLHDWTFECVERTTGKPLKISVKNNGPAIQQYLSSLLLREQPVHDASSQPPAADDLQSPSSTDTTTLHLTPSQSRELLRQFQDFIHQNTDSEL